MRILVLIYEFPPVGGGGGQVAEDICNGLVKRGHEVKVLTAHYGELPRLETRGGVGVIRVPSARRYPYKAGLLPMMGYIIAGFLPTLRLVREWRPDVIHVHFAVPSGALAWSVSRLMRIPYILTAHLGDVPGGVPEKTDTWFKWIFPFTHPIWNSAASVLAVSDYTRRLAKSKYAVDVNVIPNGINLETLNPKSLQAGSPPRIMFAGRFVLQKNPVQVVRTLAALRDIPWNCVMVGDGPLRQTVEDEIRNLGISNRFTLTGWITPDEVINWFAKSDILFMPSLSEGLPVVGVQALGMGLAIVAGRVGGFIDLVEPGQNGHLMDKEEDDNGVEILRRLLTHPDLLTSYKKASRQIARRFDIQNIVQDYEKVLLKVLDG
jgi:glycosyltransferase involved in cell wall biosynthesis